MYVEHHFFTLKLVINGKFNIFPTNLILMTFYCNPVALANDENVFIEKFR